MTELEILQEMNARQAEMLDVLYTLQALSVAVVCTCGIHLGVYISRSLAAGGFRQKV